MSVADLTVVNIAAYKFVELDRLPERREQVRELVVCIVELLAL